MKIEHLNATFQPAKIGHPHGLQVTYLKDNSTRNIFVYHEDGKVGAAARAAKGSPAGRRPPARLPWESGPRSPRERRGGRWRSLPQGWHLRPQLARLASEQTLRPGLRVSLWHNLHALGRSVDCTQHTVLMLSVFKITMFPFSRVCLWGHGQEVAAESCRGLVFFL